MKDVDYFARFAGNPIPFTPAKAIPSERLYHCHFGILGLSSLILSFPYRLLNWMPHAIVVIASHNNDPEPVRSTVQKTINEFRRTHQDTWHEDQRQFTPDELKAFLDISTFPSYYA
jgi:proteasome activator subunit 4